MLAYRSLFDVGKAGGVDVECCPAGEEPGLAQVVRLAVEDEGVAPECRVGARGDVVGKRLGAWCGKAVAIDKSVDKGRIGSSLCGSEFLSVASFNVVACALE
jgi:hypothetical protein